MAPLFDVYIVVDWSAASKPVTGANSIWVGVLSRPGQGPLEFESHNPSTRLAARALILDQVQDHIARGSRVLLGFDFALGYPAGTAKAARLDIDTVPPWRAMHDYLARQVDERPDNSNDRFEIAAQLNAAMTDRAHPFWGAPASKTGPTLAPKKGDFTESGSLPEHRLSEAWIRSPTLALISNDSGNV